MKLLTFTLKKEQNLRVGAFKNFENIFFSPYRQFEILEHKLFGSNKKDNIYAECNFYYKGFIYHSDHNIKLAKENSVTSPSTAYAISKKNAEKEIIKFADKNFNVIIFRMVTLFGYSPRMRFDVLINNLAASYIKEKKIILRSNGKLIRPQIHVNDVVQFYQQAVDRNDINSQIINIGRPDYNVKILNLVKKIVTKLKCPLKIGLQDVDERSYKVSFKKQNQVFKNIVYKGDLHLSINEIFKKFKKKHDFNNINYFNLKTLHKLKEKRLINYLL